MSRGRFGRYQLLQRLGAGAVGEVLLVSDGRRRFALKRLLPHLGEGAAAATFATEAGLAARLRHPNVVAVLDEGRIDGVPYLVMEYVDGGSLQRLLRARGRCTPLVAAFVARELCRALEHVHAATDEVGRPLALVHRDVSPANVLLSRSGEIKLCDFGIAKALAAASAGDPTRSGVVRGKLGYASPEQVAGEPLDARTDVYSVGAVLFEALTGRCPFEPDEEGTVVARVGAATGHPSQVAPAVPAELDRICARALARSREERFASSAEMAAALDAVLDAAAAQAELAAAMEAWLGERASERATETRTRTLARAATGGRRWAGAMLALLALVAGVWAIATFARRRPPPAGVAAAAPATTPATPTPSTQPATPTPTAPPADAAHPPAHADHRAPTRPTRKPARRPAAHAGSDFMPDPFHR